ncbi:MAG: choice-of-anchor Q domain-containing protein [Anaerolineales bacterium]
MKFTNLLHIPALRAYKILLAPLGLMLLIALAGCAPPAAFTVNNSGDAGDTSPGDGKCRIAASPSACTLRAAMEEANALAGSQTILFDLNDGDHYIYPLSPLPEITDPVVIDGTSQPGFDGGKPVVHVDGSLMVTPPPVDGFRLAAGKDATIKGLQVLRFSGNGIANTGNLLLDHMEIAANALNGVDSFAAAGGIDLTILHSTVFENGDAGVAGINTRFAMDSVTMDRNTGGGLRVTGGSLDLENGGVADNTSSNDGAGIFLSMAGDPSIRNTTITGNTSDQNGGGLYLWGLPGTMMLVMDCTFDGNSAYDGGGIYIDAGTSHLASSLLINNVADRHGGGVFVNVNNNPTLWVESSTEIGRPGSGNTANFDPATHGLGGGVYNMNNLNISDSYIEGNAGDGIFNDAGEVRLLDSTVAANTLSGIESFVSGSVANIIITRSRIASNGLAGIGAINADLDITLSTISNNLGSGIRMNGGTLAMDQSEVRNNSYGHAGGGISAYNISAVLQNSTVSDNSSLSSGGGLYLWGLAAVKIDLLNMTISGNTAATTGGGLEVGSGNFGINNVTIAENIANDGGGIHVENPSLVTLRNTVLSDNIMDNCSGLPVTSLGYNLDDGFSCGFAGTGDLSGLPASLGPLADNGGPTKTHALLPGSPALDAGEDATCLLADQRGVARPQGLHCDMGAFEAESPATATPPTVTLTPTPTSAPTETGTPTLAAIVFDPVNFSSELIYNRYARSCSPKEVTVQVMVSPAEAVKSLGLFYRLEEKDGTNQTGWSEGFSMIPQGGGWYTLTLYSEDFPTEILEWNNAAVLAIQFVANGPDGEPIARSPVFRMVTVGRCLKPQQ